MRFRINLPNAKLSEALTTFMTECHKINPSLEWVAITFMLIVILPFIFLWHAPATFFHFTILSCHRQIRKSLVNRGVGEWKRKTHAQKNERKREGGRELNRVCKWRRREIDEINVPPCFATGWMKTCTYASAIKMSGNANNNISLAIQDVSFAPINTYEDMKTICIIIKKNHFDASIERGVAVWEWVNGAVFHIHFWHYQDEPWQSKQSWFCQPELHTLITSELVMMAG